MPPTLNCPCGKSMEVPEKYAGKRVRCPICKETVLIPAIPVTEEDEAARFLLSDAGVVRKPAPKRDPDDRGFPRPQGLVDPADRYPTDPEDEQRANRDPRRSIDRGEPAVRPTKRIDKGPPNRRLGDRGTDGHWFNGINAGVGGGLILMAIAVIMFFGCLLLGVFVRYTAILFFIGLFAVIKGMWYRN